MSEDWGNFNNFRPLVVIFRFFFIFPICPCFGLSKSEGIWQFGNKWNHYARNHSTYRFFFFPLKSSWWTDNYTSTISCCEKLPKRLIENKIFSRCMMHVHVLFGECASITMASNRQWLLTRSIFENIQNLLFCSYLHSLTVSSKTSCISNSR